MAGGKGRAQPVLEHPKALLVVGDVDPDLGLRPLQDQDYTIDRVAHSTEILAAAEPGDYDVVLVDLTTPRKGSSIDIAQLKRIYSQAKLIILDGEGSIEGAVAAIKAGAWDYLHRPIAPLELRAKIAQAFAPDENSAAGIGDPVVAYISQHATAISSRAEVASRFGLSLDTVSSRVRAVTGQTFIEYLHLCRLDQARQLLESTELNVSQVAARVGFSTPQHFSRVFRKHTGLSPARYRLQARAQ